MSPPQSFDDQLLLMDYEDRLAEGDLTDAERTALNMEVQRLRSPSAPEPEITIEQLQPSLSPFEARIAIEAQAKAAGERAVQERQGLVTPEELERIRERERDRARREIEANRSRTVVPGQQPVEAPDAGFFRPTRIRTLMERPFSDDPAESMRQQLFVMDLEDTLEREDLTEQQRASVNAQLERFAPQPVRYYRNPESGVFTKATARQELAESIRQQQLMTEPEARRLAGRGEAPMGILARQEEGAGVVETPLMATLRGGFGLAEGIVGEAYRAGLGYEVDEEGNPLDESDMAYQIRQRLPEGLRKDVTFTELLLPVVGGPVALLNLLGEERPAEFLRSSKAGIGSIPLPFSPYTATTKKSTTLDPEGRMVVSDIEVPSFADDPAGFFEAETRRLARNVSVGRGLIDEVRDSPVSADYAREVYGSEQMACGSCRLRAGSPDWTTRPHRQQQAHAVRQRLGHHRRGHRGAQAHHGCFYIKTSAGCGQGAGAGHRRHHVYIAQGEHSSNQSSRKQRSHRQRHRRDEQDRTVLPAVLRRHRAG